MRYLVTGGLGFIGSHVVDALLFQGHDVTVVDNLESLKSQRPKTAENIKRRLESSPLYEFVDADITDPEALSTLLPGEYDVVIHLAALAGVRDSIYRANEFYEVNVMGTHNILELSRAIWKPRHLVFGSSSSVYGTNPRTPWKESDHDLQPISPYAASKLAGEAMCRVYSMIHGMEITALRFFTVYGPRQRRDLAIHKFAERIRLGMDIPIYGGMESRRDYTFIDDVVAGILLAARRKKGMPFEIINIGTGESHTLRDLVTRLTQAMGTDAKLNVMSYQKGDVPRTQADRSKCEMLLGWAPNTPLTAGIQSFVEWFRKDFQ